MAKKQYQLVTCTINGREVEQMVDVRASLTDMLRNDFRLTSVKKGCEVGECGACNVLIDGEFKLELKNPNLRFRGSANQRVINVQESMKQDAIVSWDDGEGLSL